MFSIFTYVSHTVSLGYLWLKPESNVSMARGAFHSIKKSGNSWWGRGGGGVEITGKSSPLFNHSCPGLVSSSLEIEFNMTDPEASKYIISMLHLTND